MRCQPRHSSPSILAAEAGGLVNGEDQRQGSAALDSAHQRIATLADRGDEFLHDEGVPEGADAGGTGPRSRGHRRGHLNRPQTVVP